MEDNTPKLNDPTDVALFTAVHKAYSVALFGIFTWGFVNIVNSRNRAYTAVAIARLNRDTWAKLAPVN